jgi:hypothetical protein
MASFRCFEPLEPFSHLRVAERMSTRFYRWYTRAKPVAGEQHRAKARTKTYTRPFRFFNLKSPHKSVYQRDQPAAAPFLETDRATHPVRAPLRASDTRSDAWRILRRPFAILRRRKREAPACLPSQRWGPPVLRPRRPPLPGSLQGAQPAARAHPLERDPRERNAVPLPSLPFREIPQPPPYRILQLPPRFPPISRQRPGQRDAGRAGSKRRVQMGIRRNVWVDE